MKTFMGLVVAVLSLLVLVPASWSQNKNDIYNIETHLKEGTSVGEVKDDGRVVYPEVVAREKELDRSPKLTTVLLLGSLIVMAISYFYLRIRKRNS